MEPFDYLYTTCILICTMFKYNHYKVGVITIESIEYIYTRLRTR